MKSEAESSWQERHALVTSCGVANFSFMTGAWLKWGLKRFIFAQGSFAAEFEQPDCTAATANIAQEMVEIASILFLFMCMPLVGVYALVLKPASGRDVSCDINGCRVFQ